MRMPSDKEANAPVFEIDSEFGEMAVTMGQTTWSITELSQREKAFACVAADVCMRDLGLPFQMHIHMARANDVPLKDVREAILQVAVEAGHTGALLALKRFKEICVEIGESLPPDGRSSPGASVDYFSGLHPKTIDAELSQMWHPIMPAHWSRGGLSLRERAFISLTSNLLQGVLSAPFSHHVRLARAGNASDEQIRALFRFLSEYGFSRSWAALNALAKVAKDQVLAFPIELKDRRRPRAITE